MKLNEAKIQPGGVSSSNGSLERDQEDSDFHDAFELTNGSVSTGSVSPIDTIPFNIEGIQTVIKNGQEPSLKTCVENGMSSSSPSLVSMELQRCKTENDQLRAALKEASRVNQQWRTYHDQRQGYEQKLLSSLQDLQQSSSLTQENGRSSVELQRLREAFSRQLKEHNEHIQLLQLQVRAHRDDWEAERSEKKAAEFARIQAEAQLRVVQRQLEEVSTMVSDLEGRLKLCKCFGGCEDTASNADKKTIPFHYQNGSSLSVTENTTRLSPSFSTTTSIGSGTSRSSSVSKDFSTCSSPTMAKGFGLLAPCNTTAEGSRTSSPSVRLNITKSPNPKTSETHPVQEKNGPENHSCTPFTPPNQQDEAPTSTKATQYSPDLLVSGKCKGNIKLRADTPLDTSLHYYESKGARPKTVGKSNDEEERQAKHRARSILASALPMSPSSSKPSSPVTVSPGKGTKLPKGYIPITSTVLTPAKFRPLASLGVAKSEPDLSVNLKNKSSKNKSKFIENNQFKTTRAKSPDSLASLASTRGDASPKGKHTSSRRSAENLASCNINDQTEYRQCSKIQINGTNSHNTGSINHSIGSSKNNGNWMKKSKSIPEESAQGKDGLDIKTATKMKQNTKSLIVTNNQGDKINTNYASITVMPGPSSALYSHTQATSTTSSRSSSPGISLTTFALNANGQGVPGAFFFALGTDSKTSKSPQPQLNVPGHSSSANTQQQEEVQLLKTHQSTCKETFESEVNDKIVNSTWVQLMDKETHSTRPASRTPWRTARAVPSHKLNSVRKIQPDETPSTTLTPVLPDDLKQEDTSYFNSNGCGNKTCNGQNYLKPQSSYETRYQTSISPTPNYVSCSRASPSISLTPPSHSQTNFRNGNSPTICIIPHHSNYTQAYAEADLRSMASRNISSAILSYECGSKGCSNLKGSGQLNQPLTDHAFYPQSSVIPIRGIETSSEHCLICPSCQKLFPENSPKYIQHLRGCGGPKYVDM